MDIWKIRFGGSLIGLCVYNAYFLLIKTGTIKCHCINQNFGCVLEEFQQCLSSSRWVLFWNAPKWFRTRFRWFVNIFVPFILTKKCSLIYRQLLIRASWNFTTWLFFIPIQLTFFCFSISAIVFEKISAKAGALYRSVHRSYATTSYLPPPP